MKPAQVWQIIGGLIMLGTLAVGITRHIDALEGRIQQMELKLDYLHGSFAVPPKGTR